MIFALTIRHKIYRLLFITLSLLPTLISESSHAALTTEAIHTKLYMAQEAIDREDPEQAEDILREVLIADKNNALAYQLLGVSLIKRGRVDDAIEAITQALQIDPQDDLSKEFLFSIYYNRAQDLLENPQEAYKARDPLKKAIALQPSGIMSYYYLGSLNYQEKRDAECIEMLQTVADTIPEKLRPNLHAMLFNSAVNLLSQKRAQELKGLVDYFSSQPGATINDLLLSATISLEIDDYVKSAETYYRILSIDPQNTVALHNRSVALQRLEEIRIKEATAASLQQQTEETTSAEDFVGPQLPQINNAP